MATGCGRSWLLLPSQWGIFVIAPREKRQTELAQSLVFHGQSLFSSRRLRCRVLQVLGNPRRFCDGITRREAMTIGGLSVLGGQFGLSRLLALEQSRRSDAPAGKAKNVIVLYLHGGAPTQDMFDLKPHAPQQIRGEFQPIATSVPGIEISEHLPETAQRMHHCAVLRSVHHKAGCHNTLPSFTGSEQPVSVIDPVPKDSFPPGMGAVCEYLKPPHIEMPHYVALPTHLGWGFRYQRPGPHGGFLGKRYEPLCGECKPELDKAPPAGRLPFWLGTPTLANTALGAEMTIDRLDRRRSLLQQIEDERRNAELRQAALDGTDGRYGRVRDKAFGLLTASQLRGAFDVNREDPAQLERYGNHLFGRSVLVGRRLIEAGVRFVDVYWDYYEQGQGYWDTHSKNFSQLKQLNLPILDQTYSALLDDLEARGLLRETLVVMMSDMGRTPTINAAAGRDHWTDCYSVVLAGAGIRGGTVYGASDAHAAYVKDHPLRPSDICATIYQCLGIDPETLLPDREGRPVSIAQGGEPVRDVLA